MRAITGIAFVLGLGENGYGVLRSLARNGIPAWGFDREGNTFARYSRFCKRCKVQPFTSHDESLCATLLSAGKHCGGKPFLFPTTDEYVCLLARHREHLADRFFFHWISSDALLTIVNKAHMNQICKQAGVLTPRTHVSHPNENVARHAADFTFPCIIKPNRSFDSQFPQGRKNFIAHSPQHLIDFYERNPGLNGETIWQEIIQGGDENIFQCTALIRQSGEVGAVFSTRKIRQYLPHYGSMCFGRSEGNPAVVSEAVKLLRFLKYRGLASLEFKYQPTDGRLYFVEMNPRLPWYSALFADAGVNLPHLAFLDLTKPIDILPMDTYRQTDGVYWISVERDLRWFFQMRKERSTSLINWLRSVARAHSFAWWEWRDPRPFLMATLDLIVKSAIHKLAKSAVVYVRLGWSRLSRTVLGHIVPMVSHIRLRR